MANNRDRQNLVEVAATFMAGLSSSQRSEFQQEVNKFVKWYGGDRRVAGITAPEVANYADTMGTTTTNADKKLQPVKALLAYAKKEGLTGDNLALHLRIRKGSTKRRPQEQEFAEEVITLTPEGYAELKAELEGLKARRPQIAEELRKARADKDFRENAPLDAAREHQAQVEARIRELDAILKASTVIQQNRQDKGTVKAGLGNTVILHDVEHGQEVRYILVHPNETDPAAGKISVASPVGKALIDKVTGDTIEVKAPVGTLRYKIESVE